MTRLARSLALAGGYVTRGEVRDHPYLRVGRGRPALVAVPGLNDPLLRATDAAWYSAFLAGLGTRVRRAGYPGAVYVFSRPVGLPDGHDTAAMADDLAGALGALDLRGDVLGVSLGGFVAQHLAARHPDRVRRLACALSAAHLSVRGRRTVARWRALAADDQWGRIYREGIDRVVDPPLRGPLRLATRAWDRLVPLPPAAVDFDVTARACLEHDASDVLPDVTAPSLVLGGTDDPFFDAGTYRATAAALGAEWARFDGAGHGALWRRSFLRDLVAFLTDS